MKTTALTLTAILMGTASYANVADQVITVTSSQLSTVDTAAATGTQNLLSDQRMAQGVTDLPDTGVADDPADDPLLLDSEDDDGLDDESDDGLDDGSSSDSGEGDSSGSGDSSGAGDSSGSSGGAGDGGAGGSGGGSGNAALHLEDFDYLNGGHAQNIVFG